jgi:hypothetical protein
VLFWFLASHDTAQLAAVLALAAFVGIAAIAFAVDPAGGDTLARYARGIAAGLLSLIAFASLLFVPFTEQYARESVPEQFWSSPRFKAVNRRLTTMWAVKRTDAAGDAPATV